MTSLSSLAEALRVWRDRASLAEAGITGRGPRQVPGLRREELAVLAGLSVDYLVRLEQGRAQHPSAQVVEALARALRLSEDEADALRRLASPAHPASGEMARSVPPGVQRMVESLTDTPTAVFTLGWEVLAWNPLWAALVGDPGDWSGFERNVAWRHFTQVGFHITRRGADLEAYERDVVADMRLAAAEHPSDGGFTALVEALLDASESFASRWRRFEIAPRAVGRKTVDHDVVGPMTLDSNVLVASHVDLRISLFSAVRGSADAEKLDHLRVAVPRRAGAPAARPARS